MFEALTLFGLFLSALLAATPIPFQSEVVFVALQTTGDAPIWQLVLVAGIGNTIGAAITYVIGFGITRWRDRKWFPATEAQMSRAERWFGKWGPLALLVSWAPGGDVICLVAGVLRQRLVVFLPLVFLAKTGRYAVLAWLTARAIALAG
ncbi:YqaA family protein [Thioclava sp. A2]|uniref:YqaA family protein n=1 Tax=Thioclava sp. FCG-A2 TaxID=3080562 RepID=UPI0029550C33|nr:YqaA family protein [Thioclava sp. A2]MDV7271167.1 YqaA family protein [Thioclava sp. A2]